MITAGGSIVAMVPNEFMPTFAALEESLEKSKSR